MRMGIHEEEEKDDDVNNTVDSGCGSGSGDGDGGCGGGGGGDHDDYDNADSGGGGGGDDDGDGDNCGDDSDDDPDTFATDVRSIRHQFQTHRVCSRLLRPALTTSPNCCTCFTHRSSVLSNTCSEDVYYDLLFCH